MTTAPSHLLIIGGTGMLRAATVALGARADTVTLIARTRARLESVAAEIASRGGAPAIVALDYRDNKELDGALAPRMVKAGPATVAVCWIHRTAPHAPATVARHVAVDGRYFHVLPHRAGDPAVARRLAGPVVEANPRLRYRRVVLGSVGPRWLDHDEISAGVLCAIDADRDTPVGEVPGWGELEGSG